MSGLCAECSGWRSPTCGRPGTGGAGQQADRRGCQHHMCVTTHPTRQEAGKPLRSQRKARHDMTPQLARFCVTPASMCPPHTCDLKHRQRVLRRWRCSWAQVQLVVQEHWGVFSTGGISLYSSTAGQ